jgi:hypothetical protein
MSPEYVFSILSLFRKNKSRTMRLPRCLCAYELPPINFWMLKPIFIKIGMYIMPPEPISTACSINPYHQSVCLCVYSPIVARQSISKKVTEATNTHPAIEELLDASFSMRSVSYQGKQAIRSQKLIVNHYSLSQHIAKIWFLRQPE